DFDHTVLELRGDDGGRGIGVARGIRCAEENTTVVEDDVVKATTMRGGRETVSRQRTVLGVDDDEVRVAVLVLKRPEPAASRIELEAVVVPFDRELADGMTVQGELNDGA